MRKILFFFLSCALVGASLSAQDTLKPLKRNSVFLEFGGNASGDYHRTSEQLSLNYDRILFIGRAVKISARIGSNIPRRNYDFQGGIESTHVIPLILGFLLGRKQLCGELGLGYGLIYINSNYKVAYGAFTSVIGLRYQNQKTGIMCRVGVTPTFGIVKSSPYFGSIAGVSIGYSF